MLSSRRAFPSTKGQDMFCDEAIFIDLKGDCFGKKRLAMTIFGALGHHLWSTWQFKAWSRIYFPNFL